LIALAVINKKKTFSNFGHLVHLWPISDLHLAPKCSGRHQVSQSVSCSLSNDIYISPQRRLH